jgi:ribosomal protein S18 acetylase RimI-like enzyme
MSWVVYDGDTPVAYMQCSKYPHDWEDRGRTEAWIDGIGTIRSHRGRGVASALITMAMRSFRDDALEFAVLGVDSENPTGANRIYERLGFVPEKRMVAFRKRVH